MRALNRLLARLWNFASDRRSDERLREEMEQHLAMQMEEFVQAGMSPKEARRMALVDFGAVEGIRESYHAEEGLPVVEHLRRDVRHSIRVLGKSAGFTA